MKAWAKALGALAVLGATLGACAPAARTVVTFDVPGAITPATKVHWELWAAASATDVGTLVLQDDVAVTSLPLPVTIAYQPTADQRLYWLAASVDVDGDGALGPGDWVLAPAPAVGAVTAVGRSLVWQHPGPVAASARP